MGFSGGVTDNSLVILRGLEGVIVPKVHGEAYDDAEIRCDLPYNDLEAGYNRIATRG